MARADLRATLESQVQASLRGGARLVAGGSRLEGRGWFYPPTVLTDASGDLPVVNEEVFGPVATIFTARDEQQAVAMANDSAFGLSAMLWTSDVERGQALARDLVVGSVFINAVTASDPRVPVGGVKLSGYGRELGRAGLHELCNLQTVWVA
jgi:acyl-CoA reductase-like NAD-dependent aldehyde dehydrogenase